jgi:hypothetical protein
MLPSAACKTGLIAGVDGVGVEGSMEVFWLIGKAEDYVYISISLDFYKELSMSNSRFQGRNREAEGIGDEFRKWGRFGNHASFL